MLQLVVFRALSCNKISSIGMLSWQTLCFLPLDVLHTFLELEKENKSK